MKTSGNSPGLWRFIFSLYGLKMKCTLLLLLVAIIQLKAGSGHAQDMKITLKIKNVSLIEAIDKIEEVSEYRFFYSKEDLNLSKRVTLDAQEQSIESVLQSLLIKSEISYKVMGNQVILTVSEGDPSPQTKTDNIEKVSVLISGKVTDEEGQPLPGVNVQIKGTSIGTVTDIDGNYKITVPDAESVLIFSSIGYLNEEITVGDRSQVDLVMFPDIQSLEEIVVVGYGTQKSSEVVSAISQVSGEDLQVEKRPLTSVQSSLLGSVPGLRGANINGSPGAVPNLSIRGNSTLNSTSPLVIIDGFEGSLTDINPQSIESISVLKDAAAVSVYGARGANGVLLVTTKNTDRNKRITTSYNFSHSVQKSSSLPSLLNSESYMQYVNTAAGIGNEIYDDSSLELARSGFYPETAWAEELYKNSANQQSHNLSVSGGSEKTGYLLSAGYLSQDGLVIGSDNFKRLNLRVKVDTDITDWLTTGVNTLISNRVRTQIPTLGSDNIRGLPFYPVRSEDGLWVDKGTPGEANPVALAASGSFTKADRDAVNMQLYAKINPLKNLVFEERVSIIKANENTRVWNNVYDYVSLDATDPDSYTNTESINRSYATGSPDARSLQLISAQGYTLRTLSTLNYKLENEINSASLLLGFQSETGESESFQAGRTGFLLDNIIDMDQGQIPSTIGGGIGNTSTRGGNATTLSYFGRFNYAFLSKYLFEASFRVDGSSFFLDNNRYGFFPSVAVGWDVAGENFMQNIELIDQLKFRASYGQTGDDSGVGARAIQLAIIDVTGYPIGGQIQPRIYLGQTTNEDLKWETATTLNIGLDASLWKGKLQFALEYFNTNRDDILDEVLTPIEFGFGNVPANLYSVKSWGWELEATHRNRIGLINYWVSGNLSAYDNEITDVAGRESINFAVGQSINDRLGYETDGFFDSQEEIDNYTSADGAGPIDHSNVGGAYVGGYKYVDQLTIDTDGDGEPDAADGAITPDDRVILDENSATNWFAGLNMGINYRGLSLSARFYGVLDNNQWWNNADAHEPFLNSSNVYEYMLDYWSPENPDAIFPAPQGTGIQAYNANVSHLIRNNEYVKLQNITLSYSFSTSMIERLRFVQGLDLSLSVENLGTVWTNSPAYEYGWDPELGVGNVDYPLPLTTSFGLNIKF